VLGVGSLYLQDHFVSSEEVQCPPVDDVILQQILSSSSGQCGARTQRFSEQSAGDTSFWVGYMEVWFPVLGFYPLLRSNYQKTLMSMF